MPALSPTMTEGTITAWKKKEGKPNEQDSLVLSIRIHFSDLDIMFFLIFKETKVKSRGLHSFRDTDIIVVYYF